MEEARLNSKCGWVDRTQSMTMKESNKMHHLMRVLVALAVTSWPLPALADSPDALFDRFVAGDGYVSQDADQLWQIIEDDLAPAASQSSVFHASAGIDPLTMAILALEGSEGTLERARYRLSYGIEMMEQPPSAIPVPTSFLQVDRFNLGPAIREELIASLGADVVAPPGAFGEGPHISWRLITRPLMGNKAIILAAGRAELSDAEARDTACLGVSCLSLHFIADEAAPWSAMEDSVLDLDVPYVAERDGLPTPAAAIDALIDGDEFMEAGQQHEIPEIPAAFLETVIEINLGQDMGVDAALRLGELRDDSIAAIWRRITAVSTGPDAAPLTFRAESYECRRGSRFPSNSGLCI